MMMMTMCKNQALQAEFILGFLCHALYILLLLPSTPHYSSSFIYDHGVYFVCTATQCLAEHVKT